MISASPSRGRGSAPGTPKSVHTQPLKPTGSRNTIWMGPSAEAVCDCARRKQPLPIPARKMANQRKVTLFPAMLVDIQEFVRAEEHLSKARERLRRRFR